MGLSSRTLEKMIARGRTQEIREEIKADRQKLSAVKLERRQRLQAITRQCRAMREAHTTDAKRQRVELRAAIEAAREVIRTKCKGARGEADEATAQRLVDAIAELDDVRDRLRVHLAGIRLPPKDPGRVRGGVAAAEKQSEMIDRVSNDLEAEAPELVPVWQNMARRMPKRYRASARRSAYEGFLEWAADNAGDVADIQDRLLGRAVDEWEAREMEEERDAYEAREAKAQREHKRLTRLTPASARKLEPADAIDRYEAVTNAIAVETDGDRIAALRRTGDILHGDLISRGYLDAPVLEDAAGEAPF